MSWHELISPSPNHATVPPHAALGVCFHHTALSFGATLAYMQSPASRVSYHVVIAGDGTRARLVADEHVAWHAGVSTFQGQINANAFLLGVAFAGDTYVAPLTEAQIASALDWLEPRWPLHQWSPDWMTDHRQIAPGRKTDLAPAEWERLITAIKLRFA